MQTVQALIETLLKEKIGLDANSIGSKTIDRAVEQRQIACGLHDRAAYWVRLRSVPQEFEQLVEAVVVPETWFFRDREPFLYLQQYATTQWRKLHPKETLRVLSAPCSTGEEPYSIAMTLLEAGFQAHQFRIDAVDISQQALQKAQRGVYRRSAFRGGEWIARSKYFEAFEEGFEVRPIVRETVRFMQRNVLATGFLAGDRYGAIFCRNLLIYLDYPARQQLMRTLDHALMPLGLLFVGAAEMSQVQMNHYRAVERPFAFAYQKILSPEVSHPPVASIDRQKPAIPSHVQPVVKPSYSRAPSWEQVKQLADWGKLTDALAQGEQFLKANPMHDRAHLLVGEIYQALNQPTAAEQCFQRASYLNPEAYEALVHLALLKEAQGDRVAAARLRERIQRHFSRLSQAEGEA